MCHDGELAPPAPPPGLCRLFGRLLFVPSMGRWASDSGGQPGTQRRVFSGLTSVGGVDRPEAHTWGSPAALFPLGPPGLQASLCTRLPLPPAFCPWRGWGVVLSLEEVGVGWGLTIAISFLCQNEDASQRAVITPFTE